MGSTVSAKRLNGWRGVLFSRSSSGTFPPSSTDKELISLFQEVRPVAVVDLFCPNKRDVPGKRFGFVRMRLKREEDGAAMLDELNTLWVFIHLFDRGVTERAKPKPRIISVAFVEAGRTYSNVASGTSPPWTETAAPVHKVTFVPTEEEKEWLENVMVGLLKEEFSWEEFCKDIQMETRAHSALKHFGEGLVHIQEVLVPVDSTLETRRCVSAEIRLDSLARCASP